MPDFPTIALHLGVHKTATTYFQSRLSNSKEALAENRIAYIPLGQLRQSVTAKLDDDDFSREKMLAAISAYMDCDRLVLSDENLIGGVFKPNNNLIYDGVAQRLKKLLSLLSGFQVEIFITLRSYPEYFISRYTESLRHFKFFSFERYYENIDFESVTWVDVVESLKEAGAKDITISDFKTIFADENAYFNKLLKKDNLCIKTALDSPSIRRPKISKEAYNVVKCYGNNYSRASIAKLMNLLDNTPQKTTATEFMPFTEEQIKNFAGRYANELASFGVSPLIDGHGSGQSPVCLATTECQTQAKSMGHTQPPLPSQDSANQPPNG